MFVVITIKMIKAVVLLSVVSLAMANEIEVEGNVPEDRIIGEIGREMETRKYFYFRMVLQ